MNLEAKLSLGQVVPHEAVLNNGYLPFSLMHPVLQNQQQTPLIQKTWVGLE